ncbi:I78 family peptidase inhibitor [Sphingobium nicotianae]|uniref:Peptidase inhibitor I78 n=1 Tax=Sphingobium nicotianae TaxID=2782607 RepID=A0A9X1DGB0_9SPHN|nr:I78 family peptidase inhibitor [Sphingobium nicotianae]MBT2189364.1 peptidase inhibitor I78 [Sphingobium nicotianae]
MRFFSVLPALLGLTACATTTTQGPATPSPNAGKCTPEGLDAYVGRKASSELGAELLARSGAKTLRWGPPGSAMTMDYREDRLTISYDDQMLVTRASCG